MKITIYKAGDNRITDKVAVFITNAEILSAVGVALPTTISEQR